MPGDQHVVGIRLGDTSGDGADTALRNQLDADPRARIHRLQIVDELGQILDRVDVVMRWGRDQRMPGTA